MPLCVSSRNVLVAAVFELASIHPAKRRRTVDEPIFSQFIRNGSRTPIPDETHAKTLPERGTAVVHVV